LVTSSRLLSGADLVGVTDIEVARGLWQKLLDPTPLSGPNTWQVSDGPAIRLVQAKENTTQGLVITVASLQQAKTFLREKGLLGTDSEKDATISPLRIHGLNIKLVEKEG
jgi:hypothetical protein